MKIKLKNNLVIKKEDIKKIYGKPKKLFSCLKIIKTHYCIELKDGDFIEITKSEYKFIKDLLKEEK